MVQRFAWTGAGQVFEDEAEGDSWVEAKLANVTDPELTAYDLRAVPGAPDVKVDLIDKVHNVSKSFSLGSSCFLNFVCFNFSFLRYFYPLLCDCACFGLTFCFFKRGFISLVFISIPAFCSHLDFDLIERFRCGAPIIYFLVFM